MKNPKLATLTQIKDSFQQRMKCTVLFSVLQSFLEIPMMQQPVESQSISFTECPIVFLSQNSLLMYSPLYTFHPESKGGHNLIFQTQKRCPKSSELPHFF